MSADALCPLHVSSCRTLHSSGTFFDTELNVWVFSNDEHQFAHNRSVQTMFSGPSRGFSSGILDSDRTPGEYTGLQFSKPAQDNKLSKSFARGLTRNPLSVLINSLSRHFVSDHSCEELVFNRRIFPMAVKVLTRASLGQTNTPSSNVFAHHDTSQL